MKRLLLILIFLNCANSKTQGQSFNIDDLISMAYLPSEKINRFMNKKGFVHVRANPDSNGIVARFTWKRSSNNDDKLIKRYIDLIKKGDTRYILFHTSILNDFRDGENRLIKDGFFYDDKVDISKESSVLFQKRNISIQATDETGNDVPDYTFLLKQKEIPDINNIKYADDLLRFDSHEYLVSFFGEQSVKKDFYFFSKNELKKCSVLFENTNRQVVFVWGDQNNLNDLSYIIISNLMPTKAGITNSSLTGNNEWQTQNGIHTGMTIKELLKLNKMDFGIYGNQSELAFMVKPGQNDGIDFNKTAVMLSCDNCNDNKIFDQPLVSAIEVVKKNLPMRVFDIVIYSAPH
ncbi:MAG: hypothetical protein Q8891_09435 [Bacteroidota bacterium]|jgi:hypothetical protein|nr:hypothetical protein [Bacteroidota bacterium]